MTESLVVRDLDGDGEPEVMVMEDWGGTHCCEWSAVYRYDPARRTYRADVHFWGDAMATPRLRDLNGDGKPEFVSADARFAYAFGSYAGSIPPPQYWSYANGRFTDVTRRYPNLLRAQAAALLAGARRYAVAAEAFLAAWAASECRLGRYDVVAPTVEAFAARRPLVSEGSPQTAASYLRGLDGLLRRLGYR